MALVLAGVAAAVALATVWAPASGTRHATACPSRTAWAGSETPVQHNGPTLVRIAVREPIVLTRLNASAAYVARAGQPNDAFSELLVLVGALPGRLSVTPGTLLPVLSGDPAFGPLQVDSPVRHNQNRALADGVYGALILKANPGGSTGTIDVPLDLALPAGSTLWVHYDSLSTAVLDPEVQLVATFRPARC